MEHQYVALVAPGGADLPPRPSTSVEIYLYDLWRELSRRVGVCLYTRSMISERHPAGGSRRALAEIGRAPYITRVIRDLQMSSVAPDVIQIDNRPLYIALMRRAFRTVPLVLGMHSMTFLQPQRITKRDARSNLDQASGIVVNSHFVAQRLEQEFTAQGSKIRVIYPGVDTGVFHPPQNDREWAQRRHLRNHLGIGKQTMILCAGRVIERKGVHVALAAIKELQAMRLPPPILCIAGTRPPTASPYGRQLSALARSVSVRWLGYLTRSRLSDVYRAADLFLCPSQKDEAFGLVNLEAQASGVPVIASAAWGLKESVREQQTGLLVTRYRDPPAWAQAIAQVLRDPDLRSALGAEGPRRMRARFLWSRQAERYLDLYRHITE